MARRRSPLSPMETIIGLFMDIGLAEASAALSAACVIVGRRMAVDGAPRESAGRRRRAAVAPAVQDGSRRRDFAGQPMAAAMQAPVAVPATAPAPPVAPTAPLARRRPGRPVKAKPTAAVATSGPVAVPAAGPRRRRPSVTDAPPAAAATAAHELPDQTPGDYE